MKSHIPVYDINTFGSYKNPGIYAGRFGPYSKLYTHLHTAHRHTFYHLVYFSKARGQQQIDFQRFDVEPGQIYFMVPGQVHSWHFTEDPEGYIINFSKDYFSAFLLNAAYLENFAFFSYNPNSQVIQVDLVSRPLLCSLFETILEEGHTFPPSEDDLVKTILLQVFILVQRMVPENTGKIHTKNMMIVKDYQKLIEKNFTGKKFPKQYAELLCITPNRLNALCIEVLNKPAGKIIRERILLEAKRLLVNLDLNVFEISQQLDFKDQSYFIKFFKKYSNVTPEKFRSQNKIK